MIQHFFNLRMRLEIWRVRRRNTKLLRQNGGKNRKTLSCPQWTDRQRGLFYFFALGACAAAVVAAGMISYLSSEFQLLDAQGQPLIAQELILLDPYHRNEITLQPGHTAQRPIALVHTGAQPVLLRVRVDETILTRRRCEDGELITTVRARNLASDALTPHTITRQQAHDLLIEVGFVPPNSTWEQVLAARVSAHRLPGGDNAGGRLLVLEKIQIDQDALDPDLPDLSALRPEDLYTLDLGITLHEFMGFYLLPQDDGDFLFQPLVLLTQDNRDLGRAPTIQQILHEYVEWDVVQHDVHRFTQEDSMVNIQGGATLRPLNTFTEPENAWFADSDGWVYYGMTLLPGVMTPVLMENYSLPRSHNDDVRYHIQLVIQPEPLQYAINNWGDGGMLNIGVNSTTARARRMIREIIE
jgi:hypothetical protein